MDDYLEILRHDAFRYGGGLNKSAAEVYWWLKQAPMTASLLIRKTGRGRTTVFRSLQRMANVIDGRTGEIISMVENRNGVWHLVPDVDLNRIALLVGTASIGKRKREQYRREQLDHHKSLLLGRKARQ
jgi:hypothetical protein